MKFYLIIILFSSYAFSSGKLPDLLEDSNQFNVSMLEDLVEVERKKIEKRKQKLEKLSSEEKDQGEVQRHEVVTVDEMQTLSQFSDYIGSMKQLSDTQKKRLQVLLYEMENRFDDAYLTLKKIPGYDSKLWYQMKELYLSEKLGLEEEKKRLEKKIQDKLVKKEIAIKKVKFCSKVTQFGEYTEIKAQSLEALKMVILYVEIADLTQKMSKTESYHSGVNAKFSIFDEADAMVYQHPEKIEFNYTSQSKKSDYYIWLKWKPRLSTGKYRIKFEVVDRQSKKTDQFDHEFNIY